MSSYLFLLCPPYSGSTLLWKLLSTSTNVASLPSEGQFLPELKDIMRDSPWKAETALPWPEIKKVWETYWDQSKPVLLEKSPPNMIRTRDIQQHFQPVRFVVMVRNPYAQAEGLMRHNNWTATRAANFSMMCLRVQLANARELDDALVMTYESLVEDPAQACTRLAGFLPELSDIDPTASFEIHSIDGTLNRPITNLNDKKIAALGTADLATMNGIFSQHRATIEAWRYDLMVDQATQG
ncbi:MAG: sulfotransferase [Halioglobus sp.]|nr:sulfotransferase [Halioglobus sp.]